MRVISSVARLHERLAEDVQAVRSRDPSARSVGEALLAPGLRAVWAHRLAHELYDRGHRLSARTISELARLSTGIDIHPGARLGRRVFIDHGCGTVVGETAVIGDDVTLFHNVTLGSRGWWQDQPGQRRHPVVGARTVVGSGASVLGSITVGADALVGAHAMVLCDMPTGSHVPAGTVVSEARAVSGAPAEQVTTLSLLLPRRLRGDEPILNAR